MAHHHPAPRKESLTAAKQPIPMPSLLAGLGPSKYIAQGKRRVTLGCVSFPKKVDTIIRRLRPLERAKR